LSRLRVRFVKSVKCYWTDSFYAHII
jgi:hypothetical protein